MIVTPLIRQAARNALAAAQAAKIVQHTLESLLHTDLNISGIIDDVIEGVGIIDDHTVDILLEEIEIEGEE